MYMICMKVCISNTHTHTYECMNLKMKIVFEDYVWIYVLLVYCLTGRHTNENAMSKSYEAMAYIGKL